ncbi:MAG: Trp operon repressor [uncultured bacterium]|nr:MAG: Trp operon repressor [uncultured bacterium]
MKSNMLVINWQSFIELILKIRTEKQLVELFDFLLTDAEQEDIAVRYAIIVELLAGKKTQREIAEQLKISTAKVTRGSNALRIADPEIKKIIVTQS